MEPYADHDKALREHHALLRARARALLVPTSDLLSRAAFLSRALLFHHHVESTVFFPYLRRSGADLSFLDPLEAEHRVLAGLCERVGVAPLHDIAAIARDLVPLLDVHTAEEETALAPERLRTLITPAGLVEVARESERLRLALLAGGRRT
ncbi:MAG: hemerythrin domain-containing protein [Kofleriaceae bacterium]